LKRTGPPKKPTSLKLLQGTFRRDRVAPNEAKPETAIPEMPKHLSPIAQKEWQAMTAELYNLGLLSRIDGAALAAYCECYNDWVESSAKCATGEGPNGEPLDRKVIKTAAGNYIENPYYSIKKRSMELMHKFLTEFGMTPASRTRINAIEPTTAKASADPAEKYFG
jgi:P27 family predicted phage terminase small subunit